MPKRLLIRIIRAFKARNLVLPITLLWAWLACVAIIGAVENTAI